jgi:CheY-like chemotaxis protein
MPAIRDHRRRGYLAACVWRVEYVQNIAEPVQPGQYVMVAVSDSGSGMSAEVLSKAFDPFFTTKEIGKGTGLGLSQVHGFVRQSGGHIRIYSELGQGTTVKLYLPRAPAPLVAEGNENIEVERPLGTASETILVVEDDDTVREFTVSALIELGYRVLQAKSGPSAFEILRTEAVDLLFTDVVLPDGVNGRELAVQATRQRPNMGVLYTTGYTRNAIVHQGRLDPGIDFIGKPFTHDELAIAVRSILDRS